MTRWTPLLLAFLLALAASASANGSRFLVGLGPKSMKCFKDPTVCRAPGSGGPTCCFNRCVHTDSDTLNCGLCGRICKFTDSCCQGRCVDTTFNKQNCGGCGNRCSPGAKCLFGLCEYA